jgi:hypothetical protein
MLGFIFVSYTITHGMYMCGGAERENLLLSHIRQTDVSIAENRQLRGADKKRDIIYRKKSRFQLWYQRTKWQKFQMVNLVSHGLFCHCSFHKSLLVSKVQYVTKKEKGKLFHSWPIQTKQDTYTICKVIAYLHCAFFPMRKFVYFKHCYHHHV